MESTAIRSVEKWSERQGGVFEISDLKILLNEESQATLFRKIAKLIEYGSLVKIKKGIYAVPAASLEAVVCRIIPGSYISCGTVLAKRTIIGSYPVKKLQAIKLGRPRRFETGLGIIEYMSVNPRLYTGFNQKNGINYATAEKAFLDVCYLYYKGRRFSFDPESDVNMELLDKTKVSEYLKLYDRKFVTYFSNIWGPYV